MGQTFFRDIADRMHLLLLPLFRSGDKKFKQISHGSKKSLHTETGKPCSTQFSHEAKLFWRKVSVFSGVGKRKVSPVPIPSLHFSTQSLYARLVTDEGNLHTTRILLKHMPYDYLQIFIQCARKLSRTKEPIMINLPGYQWKSSSNLMLSYIALVKRLP